MSLRERARPWLSRALAPWLMLQGTRALRQAERRGLPGTGFFDFGRTLGRRLVARAPGAGLDYLLTPVSSVRYFEFAFCREEIPWGDGPFLDLGSPRLFSLWLARERPRARIAMLNPDVRDADISALSARCLGLSGIEVRACGDDGLSDQQPGYQAAWSISVLEHVHGEGGDTRAIQAIWRCLAPGGRLLVTVPVDRAHREERRERDAYGLSGVRDAQGQVFFQRFYDRDSLQRRLLDGLGVGPSRLRWFGERRAGWFDAYTAEWIRRGHRLTVHDPQLMADAVTEFEDYAAMPGAGVCAFRVDKPAQD